MQPGRLNLKPAQVLLESLRQPFLAPVMAHSDVDPKTGEAFSLVEYTTPLAVNAKSTIVDAFGHSTLEESAPGASTRPAPPGSKHVSANDSLRDATARRQRPGAAASSIIKAAAARNFSPSADALKVLHAVVPPREWLDHEGGTLFSQHVLDSELPTRDDVLEVERMLNHELKARQARPASMIAVATTAAGRARAADADALLDLSGTVLRHGCLCPVREALFSQVFDELIRQVRASLLHAPIRTINMYFIGTDHFAGCCPWPALSPLARSRQNEPRCSWLLGTKWHQVCSRCDNTGGELRSHASCCFLFHCR